MAAAEIPSVDGETRVLGAAQIGGATHVGVVRSENQDRFNAVAIDGGVALILADGMGGMPGGAEAAEKAVAAASAALTADGALSAAAAVTAAIEAVGEAAAAHALRAEPFGGTTLVVALVRGDEIELAHLGDSRAYACAPTAARPLTHDHTVAQIEVDGGRLSPAAARHDPRRNHLTAAVTGEPFDPDESRTTLQPDERLLLCSDGVWEPLEDGGLGELMHLTGSPGELAAGICMAALRSGSRDNVTALLLLPEAG